jgi:hypothetical protein
MPSAGFGDPADMLTQHIKLKPPVNQWLLRTGTSCPGLFRAAVIRRWHD